MNEISEINKISETEYRINKNRTYILDNDILFVIAEGEQTTEMAHKQFELNNHLTNLEAGKINNLIDLNKAGKSSSEARKIRQRLIEDEKTAKVALFGLHPVAKVIASFSMSVIQKKDMQFFFTREEALKWINA